MSSSKRPTAIRRDRRFETADDPRAIPQTWVDHAHPEPIEGDQVATVLGAAGLGVLLAADFHSGRISFSESLVATAVVNWLSAVAFALEDDDRDDVDASVA